jgi:hypothetical protein
MTSGIGLATMATVQAAGVDVAAGLVAQESKELEARFGTGPGEEDRGVGTVLPTPAGGWWSDLRSPAFQDLDTDAAASHGVGIRR